MSKLEFKAEDFRFSVWAEESAKQAQAIYDKHLETLPKVFGYEHKYGSTWNAESDENDTHIARLEAMEKLEELK